MLNKSSALASIRIGIVIGCKMLIRKASKCLCHKNQTFYLSVCA